MRKELGGRYACAIRGDVRQQVCPNAGPQCGQQRVESIPGAGRRVPVPMAGDCEVTLSEERDLGGRVDVESVAEPRDQPDQRIQLGFGRIFGVMEVADDAHADVRIVRRRVCSSVAQRTPLVDGPVASNEEMVSYVTPALAHVVALDTLNLSLVLFAVGGVCARRLICMMNGDGDRIAEGAPAVRVVGLFPEEVSFSHRPPRALSYDRRGRGQTAPVRARLVRKVVQGREE